VRETTVIQVIELLESERTNRVIMLKKALFCSKNVI